MRTRREILALLGISGAAIGGYAVAEVDLSDSIEGTDEKQQSTPQSTPTPPSPKFTVAEESVGNHNEIANRVNELNKDRPTPLVNQQFAYDPIDTEIDDGQLFSRVVAEPNSEGTGDRLRIVRSDSASMDMARLLRDAWGVNEETTVTGEFDGKTIRFSGNAASGIARLVGTIPDAPDSGRKAFAVRARKMDRAKTLAQSFEKLSGRK